ncbi:hypothetical protein KUTeg_019305 [Tegillarca granosa]|uniref:Uncharacterized protein n=1 Tax=Tegillarca granosa TaxID=220873 RepID=A0ABQ9EE89_TEGGR|nr:hypothetical protein KUTeg_019305 [Tegillarca granosa]
MKSYTIEITFLIVTLCVVSGKPSHSKQFGIQDFGPILNKPSGRLYNCGDPKTKFQFSWTPTILTARSGGIINTTFIAQLVHVYRRYDTTGLKGFEGKYILQLEIRTTDGKLVLCGKGIVIIALTTPN